MIGTHFDIISDLNLTSMDDCIWENKATSLFCLVAGNISADRDILETFLEELSYAYHMVFFIDGDLEHEYYDDLDESYQDLIELIEDYENVIYLHDNIIIMDDVCIVGANGWTTFDFTNMSTVNITIDYMKSHGIMDEDRANEIFKLAVTDQHYMYNAITNLQEVMDINKIIMISNTVPEYDFISHNEHFNGTYTGDVMGNNGLSGCISSDEAKKIKTWVFGKPVDIVDCVRDGIHYMNNPAQTTNILEYFPKRIEI